MRRRTVVATTAAVVAAGGAAAAVAAFAAEGQTPSAPSAPPAATAEVTRSDLVDTKSVDGTLGYADRRVLPNQAQGTVTRVHAEGAVVRRGGWLYQVDSDPVILMYGNIPMYRPLSAGADGRDVKQLERNLKALGYDPGTLDEHFSGLTAQAIREWQDDKGLPETGRVDSGQVIVADGPVRIAANAAAEGDAAGRSVVTVTTTQRTVHVDLAASDQKLARLAAKVTVEMPGGDTATGRITTIGTVAEPPADDGGEATIDVEITMSGKLGRLDQAPVTVNLSSAVHKNVLSVPVEALLALREGGYGVRVAEGSTTKIIAVDTGLFAAGRVEVTGAGLSEGTKVEVPAS